MPLDQCYREYDADSDRRVPYPGSRATDGARVSRYVVEDEPNFYRNTRVGPQLRDDEDGDAVRYTEEVLREFQLRCENEMRRKCRSLGMTRENTEKILVAFRDTQEKKSKLRRGVSISTTEKGQQDRSRYHTRVEDAEISEEEIIIRRDEIPPSGYSSPHYRDSRPSYERHEMGKSREERDPDLEQDEVIIRNDGMSPHSRHVGRYNRCSYNDDRALAVERDHAQDPAALR